ncbi:MAG: beta-ketoacyl-[acyl-carrier-protein] synthase family protein [Gammaproteobacteria bacterium]
MSDKWTHGSRRVVITGYGCLTSMGENAADTWQAMVDYKVGYKRHELTDQTIKAKYFAFIEEKKERYKGFPKQILRSIPLFGKYTLVAAREAVNHAFGNAENLAKAYSPFDCGAIMGTGWGGLDQAFDIRDEYRDTGFCNSAGSLISMPSIASAACSLSWNLRGYQNTVIGACATGTIAVGDAYEIIRSGRATMMLAGGAESIRTENNVWSIDVLQALAKEQDDIAKACCPFSLDRNGFILAEGAAVLCLEERDAAIARGANILAEITGYGMYSDARDLSAPAEDMEARTRSILTAMYQADIKPSDIDYINAHGTSTPLNDVNESDTIKRALGETAYQIPISSTKSYTGHMIAAAGSFETIVCVKTIETGLLPATLNLNNPDPACDLNYIPNRHIEGADVKTVMNLSCGFGGLNAALVLEKAQ